MSFPYETIVVIRQEALARQESLMSAGRGYPVIIDASPEGIEDMLEMLEDDETTPEEYLKRSEVVDARQWLRQNAEEELEMGSDGDLPHGDYPEDVEPVSELCFSEISEEDAADELQIALLPTEHSWQVPAYLKLGGWNACPFADAQCSVLRYWEERYGARLRVVGSDTLELTVERPPTSREEAMELAMEQYYFCSDIVDQGVETLENLAATLLNGKAWFFWWD